MTSNTLPTSNTRIKKRIKPENYTQEIYQYFRESFTDNLAYIIDDGKILETKIFFDLCIGNVRDAHWGTPEMTEWLEKRKKKIGDIATYKNKKVGLKEFLEDYRYFFDIPTTNLSGGVQTMVVAALSQNPTL